MTRFSVLVSLANEQRILQKDDMRYIIRILCLYLVVMLSNIPYANAFYCYVATAGIAAMEAEQVLAKATANPSIAAVYEKTANGHRQIVIIVDNESRSATLKSFNLKLKPKDTKTKEYDRGNLGVMCMAGACAIAFAAEYVLPSTSLDVIRATSTLLAMTVPLNFAAKGVVVNEVADDLVQNFDLFSNEVIAMGDENSSAPTQVVVVTVRDLSRGDFNKKLKSHGYTQVAPGSK